MNLHSPLTSICGYRNQVLGQVLLFAAVASTTACSSSNDTVLGENAPPGSAVSSDVIAQSSIATELFGKVRDRRVLDDPANGVSDALVSSINDFTLTLHRAQAGSQPDKNAVSSGYSMAAALSFLRAGASGVTDSDLSSLLEQNAIAETNVHQSLNAISQTLVARNNDKLVLNTANRVFTKPQLLFKESFLDIATGEYAAPITEVDFATTTQAAIELINAWSSEQTDGFIDKVASTDNIKSNTQTVLLNAIFLDAAWNEPFDDLGDLDFFPLGGTRTQVPFFGDRRDLAYSMTNELTVVRLPYAGDGLSMLIMMPADLASFESELTMSSLNSIENALEISDIDFKMPVYASENLIDANALLEPLGMPVNDLDLSDMFVQPPEEPLRLSVQQKARIEVDRNGTRAAAVTVVGIETTSLPQRVSIDQPFLYVLRDSATGLILFSGRVVDPSSDD